LLDLDVLNEVPKVFKRPPLMWPMVAATVSMV